MTDSNDVFKNEGMAIFVKGKMVIGFHPDNLENNLSHLASGDMNIGWKSILDNYVKFENKNKGEI